MNPRNAGGPLEADDEHEVAAVRQRVRAAVGHRAGAAQPGMQFNRHFREFPKPVPIMFGVMTYETCLNFSSTVVAPKFVP